MDKIVFTLWRSVGQGILSLKQKCAASIFLSFFYFISMAASEITYFHAI